ncbi:MAG: protein-disulfide reductase DsbD domain-containing protein [Acidobacteriota bacterium]
MNLRRVIFGLGLAAFTSVAAFGQTSGKVVKVRPAEPVYKVKAGSAVEAAVVIDIDPGFHINSNRPAESYLIATALKLEPLKGLTVARVVYPKAKLQKFSFSKTPMSVYEGKALLKFTARAMPALAAGSHVLKGKVRVQACNDVQCLFPKTIDVEIPFEVTK